MLGSSGEDGIAYETDAENQCRRHGSVLSAHDLFESGDVSHQGAKISDGGGQLGDQRAGRDSDVTNAGSGRDIIPI